MDGAIRSCAFDRTRISYVVRDARDAFYIANVFADLVALLRTSVDHGDDAAMAAAVRWKFRIIQSFGAPWMVRSRVDHASDRFSGSGLRRSPSPRHSNYSRME